MKFTLSWLKQHLDTEASLTQICEKLTAIGLEVECVEDRGAKLAPFTIAEIVSFEKHPQADRLNVCRVNTGKENLQIVCGAPNVRTGLKTVLSRVGDIIPATGEALKKGVIRGVESEGMMCSAAELQLSNEHSGIIDLPADAPVGANYAAYTGLNDPIIEINLTPNRADCAGVRGIARDLAAAGIGKLRPQNITTYQGTEPSRVGVTLDFAADHAKDCPLFIGRTIHNIKNAASPEWLQRQLLAIGLRPISALVDITNYLTFDCARPLHVFDADKIKGHLRVHSAKGGEVLVALNGKDYTLTESMVAISDDSAVLSLGGIMGGSSSGCHEHTTSVFIEAALFDPQRTAQTGRALQITSDARYRFERGLDPAFTQQGAELATQLVLECCGTPETIVSNLVIAGTAPNTQRSISYDPQKCQKHLGVNVPLAQQQEILTALGFTLQAAGDKFSVTIPSWRSDVMGQADLAEEIIRILGYDQIPATSLPRLSTVTTSAINLPERRTLLARRALASQGLLETVTWSFMASNLAEQFAPTPDALRLLNPISSDLDVMRPSIISNLLQAAKRSADKGMADSGLFEIGPVFRNTTPEGQILVATALRAGKTPRHWAAPSRSINAYDAKADALALLVSLGAPAASLQITADAPAYYHPGRSGSFRLGATVLGYFGELHPALLGAVDYTGTVVAAEIFMAQIPQPRSSGSAKPLLKLENLQPVSRDFAFVVARDIAVEKLIKAIKGADKNLIREVSVFDIYEGEHVAAGQKSVALSVTLQPSQQTLTEVELEAIASKITSAVTAATGAVLRA